MFPLTYKSGLTPRMLTAVLVNLDMNTAQLKAFIIGCTHVSLRGHITILMLAGCFL